MGVTGHKANRIKEYLNKSLLTSRWLYILDSFGNFCRHSISAIYVSITCRHNSYDCLPAISGD